MNGVDNIPLSLHSQKEIHEDTQHSSTAHGNMHEKHRKSSIPKPGFKRKPPLSHAMFDSQHPANYNRAGGHWYAALFQMLGINLVAYQFSGKCLIKSLLSLSPLIQSLPTYSWRIDGLKDFLMGMTIFVMHLPQGTMLLNLLIFIFNIW